MLCKHRPVWIVSRWPLIPILKIAVRAFLTAEQNLMNVTTNPILPSKTEQFKLCEGRIHCRTVTLDFITLLSVPNKLIIECIYITCAEKCVVFNSKTRLFKWCYSRNSLTWHKSCRYTEDSSCFSCLVTLPMTCTLALTCKTPITIHAIQVWNTVFPFSELYFEITRGAAGIHYHMVRGGQRSGLSSVWFRRWSLANMSTEHKREREFPNSWVGSETSWSRTC